MEIDMFRIGRLEVTGKVLLLSNVLSIILAILFSYSLAIIIWTYYLESVMIGFFSVGTMLMTGARHKASLTKAISTAGFFAMHYGLFHFVYFFFLATFTFMSMDQASAFYMDYSDSIYIFLTAGILFLSHGFSFMKNIIREHEDPYWDPDKRIDDTFARPYFRILPMHLTIIASGFVLLFVPASTILLMIFMGLKTLMDLVAHQTKHRLITGL